MKPQLLTKIQQVKYKIYFSKLNSILNYLNLATQKQFTTFLKDKIKMKFKNNPFEPFGWYCQQDSQYMKEVMGTLNKRSLNF